MRENKIRTIWNQGGAVINAWLAIPSSLSAETMSHQGFDSVTVDQQHGMVDFQSAVTMLQAISTTGAMPMTRVPWLEPGIIMRSLDAGAYGIVCPMVNTRQDAETLVAYCRYAPDGTRSFGPIRAVMYAGADYPKHANATVLAIAMIETQEALNNLEEILSVPGLDGVYIGPSDLALSLGGTPKPDQTDPKVVAAIEHIMTASKKHGVVPCIHTGSASYARKMIDQGFQMVTLPNDNTLMAGAARQAVTELREGMA